MSRSEQRKSQNKAVALQYGANNSAPMVVASGMGYMAEKIIEVASSNGVPIYEDNSLATVLTQLQLGREIPPELYQAIVEIYVYFLHFDPNARAEKDAARNTKPTPAPSESEAASEPTSEAPPETGAAQTGKE
jgi:flagellar biosynthesis protein